MACERWSLLSECSQVLQLMKKAAIESPAGLNDRLIGAGIEPARLGVASLPRPA